MLRRKPTALTITNEDILAFEEARLQRLEIANANANSANVKHGEASRENRKASGASFSSSAQIDPNDELKPLPGDKAKIVRSRDERIGAGRL